MISGWYKIYAGKKTKCVEFRATNEEFKAWFRTNEKRIIEMNVHYHEEKDDGWYLYTKKDGWNKWELSF